MKVSVSAYITGKDGYDIHTCEDSFSINTVNKTIAVADGVSQSLCPAIWSKVVVNNYVDNPECVIYNNDNDDVTFDSCFYTKYCIEYSKWFNTLDENSKFLISAKSSKVNYAASTFVGIRFNDDSTCDVFSIGDSVFFMYDSESCELKHCSSMDVEGKLEFDNSPEYITSDDNKNKYGKVIYRHIDNLKAGYIFIMTDALAAWFYGITEANELKEAINKMTTFNCHNDFYAFVQELREKRRLKDDDTTLVVINMEYNNDSVLLFKTDHVDSVENVLVSEIKNAISEKERNEKEFYTKCKLLSEEIKSVKTENEKLQEKIKQIKNIIG